MSAPPDSGRVSNPALCPERLGRYDVLLPIASGGMATVYLGRAVGIAGFERDVALKLTHNHLSDDPEFLASLMDEARLAGRIRHPNVVSVLDVEEDAYGVFIVMEYVEGDSLLNVLRLCRTEDRQIPIAVALCIMDDVLGGLHAAHELRDEQGEPLHVIHRDVTPHNVLVGVDGVAKLTDFGIAKAASRLAHTKTGLVKGKIAYMSPEQAQGHTIDRRVDVWAAGVVAWEMLTGARLFDGPNDAAILLKIVREAPTRARNLRRDLPAALDEVLMKALSQEPDDRFASALEFSRELKLAARVAGMTRAERPEVAEFLGTLLADRLQERRRKAREVHELRQRVSELAGLTGDQPSASSLPALVSRSSVDDLAAESGPALPMARPVSSIAAEHQTGSAGISSMARSLVPTQSRSIYLGAFVGGVLLALIGGLAIVAATSSEDESRAARAPSASPQPTAAVPSVLSSPASATAPEPSPSSSVSADAGSDGAPRARRPVGGRPVKAASPSRPTGQSTRTSPLSNPYKH